MSAEQRAALPKKDEIDEIDPIMIEKENLLEREEMI